MAKKSPKKSKKNLKKPPSKPPPQPFDPLAQQYETQSQFDKGVNQRARGYYTPQLQDIRRDTSQEKRATRGRQGEIESMYGGYQNELNKAFDRTNSALNQIIATQAGASGASQAALQAALDNSRAAQGSLASTVGGPAPSDKQNWASLLPAGGASIARQGALGTSVGAMLGHSASQVALPSLGRVRASEHESKRSNAVMRDLADQRSQILERVPQYQAQARQELLGSEREAANTRFQHTLAGKEFGLSKKQLGLQQDQLDLQRDQQTHQQIMDRQQIQLQRDQLQAQIDQAPDEQSAADATAYAKAYDRGVSYLNDYLQPSKGEQTKKGKTKRSLYKRSPEKAFAQLTNVIGLSEHDALVLLNNVGDRKFKSWVDRYRWRKKNPGKSILQRGKPPLKGSPNALMNQ